MNLLKAIKEHLMTKKKYNALKLKYEVLLEELDKKTIELNTERRVHTKRKEVWESKLKEQEEEIIKLKEKKKQNKRGVK